MPKTRAEVDAVWEPLHAKLSKLYYEDKKTSKELFEKAHSVVWLLHEKESIENRILSDVVDEVSNKSRSEQITELLATLKTSDVDNLLNQLKKA